MLVILAPLTPGALSSSMDWSMPSSSATQEDIAVQEICHSTRVAPQIFSSYSAGRSVWLETAAVSIQIFVVRMVICYSFR